MQWVQEVAGIIRKIRRFELQADIDTIDSQVVNYEPYVRYFKNCAAENRRHADRWRRKLMRVVR